MSNKVRKSLKIIIEKIKMGKVRENNEWYMLWLQAKPLKSRTLNTIDENSQPQSLSWYHFLGKWNLGLFIYFYEMSWISYEYECLGFYFLFFFKWAFVQYFIHLFLFGLILFFGLTFYVIWAHFYKKCYVHNIFTINLKW